MSSTSENKSRRGPKEKQSTSTLLNLTKGSIYPKVKTFDLSDGPVDIKGEKSKLARSMESRMTQLRRKHESFENTKFTNQSFSSLLSDNTVLCGTILTRVDDNETGSDLGLIGTYLPQLLELEVGESMPVVTVSHPSEVSMLISEETGFVESLAEALIGHAKNEAPDHEFSMKDFTSMLANGDIIFGELITRSA